MRIRPSEMSTFSRYLNNRLKNPCYCSCYQYETWLVADCLQTAWSSQCLSWWLITVKLISYYTLSSSFEYVVNKIGRIKLTEMPPPSTCLNKCQRIQLNSWNQFCWVLMVTWLTVITHVTCMLMWQDVVKLVTWLFWDDFGVTFWVLRYFTPN